MARKTTSRRIAIPKAIEPMEAQLVSELPRSAGWQFEPKWDGFRCLVFRSGNRVALQAKSGKPLSRYFPEVLANVSAIPAKQFVLDGELAIPIGSTLAFDSLQMRLHPAESRIRRLSEETPAILLLFDMLFSPAAENLIDEPLRRRRGVLEQFFEELKHTEGFMLTPYTRRRVQAEHWLARAGGSFDGVIAKQLEGPYLPGERAMMKVKRLRTADCVVGGFRYGVHHKLVASLLLGLYNDKGLLDHVGFTSSIASADREKLTRRLETMVGGRGFTGNAPGGPSRWSTERSSQWQPLKPNLVVEVCYDHVTSNRFRHGTRLLRWRLDKAPRQCTLDQLDQTGRPNSLVARLLRDRQRERHQRL